MKSLCKNENYLFIAYIKVHYYLLYELHVIIGRHAMEEATYRADKSPSQNLEYLLHPKEFQTLRPHEWLFGEEHISKQKSECIHCPPKVWKRPRKVGFWTILA